MRRIWTNGCFDILHIGHIKLLEFAKSQYTYKEIIGTFDVERLLFWDQESKNRYSEFCKTPLPVSDDVIDDD